MPCFDKIEVEGRVFFRPNEKMTKIHRFFIKAVCEFIFKTGGEYVFSNQHYKNRLNCVTKHRFNRFFYRTDIRHFFDSISCQEMTNIIWRLNPDGWKQTKEEIYLFLQKYFFHSDGGLVIGANASPFLADLYAFYKLDLPLVKVCKKYQVTYTRFVDDLIFSSDDIIGKKKRKKIRSIIADANLRVNHGKSLVFDLKKQKTFQFFGVGIEYGGRVLTPRKIKRRIRGMLGVAGDMLDYIPYNVLHGNCALMREINDHFHEISTGETILHKKYLDLLNELRKEREKIALNIGVDF